MPQLQAQVRPHHAVRPVHPEGQARRLPLRSEAREAETRKEHGRPFKEARGEYVFIHAYIPILTYVFTQKGT